jgi:TRAP-type C4-dicarboxylate transport system permease small subunit
MASEGDALVLRVNHWFQYFSLGSMLISAGSITFMILSTTIDTTIRYLFNSPILGVFELNENLMVACVFMATAWTQNQRGNVRVTVLLQRLSKRRVAVIDLYVWLICLLLLLVMGIQTSREAIYSYKINEIRWGSVEMPIWWAKGIVAFGCWMMSAQLLLDVWMTICQLIGRVPLEPSGLYDKELEEAKVAVV